MWIKNEENFGVKSWKFFGEVFSQKFSVRKFKKGEKGKIFLRGFLKGGIF